MRWSDCGAAFQNWQEERYDILRGHWTSTRFMRAALKMLPRERLLFFFPYVDSGNNSTGRIAQWKAFFTHWNLTRGKYQSMEKHRIQRYHNFRKRCASLLDEPLPIQLDTSLFLDFLPCGEARLLRGRIRPWWHYLFPITGANIMVDLLVPRSSKITFSLSRECPGLAQCPRLYTMPAALVTVICKRLSTVD
jgi:hypothetical protein